MATYIRDLDDFLGAEKQHELKNMRLLGEDYFLIQNLDILFNKALQGIVETREQEICVFLFMNAHREFYLAMSNYLRIHFAISFRNLRAAIDSAFTSYYILRNPNSIKLYLSQNHDSQDWNRLFGNIKRTVKTNIDDYPFEQNLCRIHEYCSSYSHSDPGAIFHRYIENKQEDMIEANYFDYLLPNDRYKNELAALLISFFRIYHLFWNIMFQNIAGDSLFNDISARIMVYKSKLFEFIQLNPLNDDFASIAGLQQNDGYNKTNSSGLHEDQ